MTADTLSEEMANKLRTLDSSLLMVRSAQVSGNMSFRSLKSYSLIWKKSALQFIFSHILKRVCLYKRAMDVGSEGIKRSTGHLHMSSELMCKLLIYTLR